MVSNNNMIFDGIKSDNFDALTWHQEKTKGLCSKACEFLRVVLKRFGHLLCHHKWETNRSLAEHVLKHLPKCDKKDVESAKLIFQNIIVNISDATVTTRLNSEFLKLASNFGQVDQATLSGLSGEVPTETRVPITNQEGPPAQDVPLQSSNQEPAKTSTAEPIVSADVSKLSPAAANWAAFYKNEKQLPVDGKPTLLKDVWGFNNSTKEHVHDFIQKLFPQQTNSPTSPPHLSQEDYAELRKDTIIIQNLRTSFESMMDFYGFNVGFNPLSVTRAVDFVERTNGEHQGWIPVGSDMDHNYLRITRILDSLCHFGLQAEAMAFFDQLKILFFDPAFKGRINNTSYAYWYYAAQGKFAEFNENEEMINKACSDVLAKPQIDEAAFEETMKPFNVEIKLKRLDLSKEEDRVKLLFHMLPLVKRMKFEDIEKGIKALIAKGTDINALDDGETLITRAVHAFSEKFPSLDLKFPDSIQVQFFKLLLSDEVKADPKIRSKLNNGDTLYNALAFFNDTPVKCEIIKLLLEKYSKKDINKRINHTFFLELAQHHYGPYKLIFDKGADESRITFGGITPLDNLLYEHFPREVTWEQIKLVLTPEIYLEKENHIFKKYSKDGTPEGELFKDKWSTKELLMEMSKKGEKQLTDKEIDEAVKANSGITR